MTATRIRAVGRAMLPVLTAVGLAALVTGCVAYPDYGYYAPGYGYGYAPGPYVAVGGGWGWHDHDGGGHDWHR